jgi:hypothetical protein
MIGETQQVKGVYGGRLEIVVLVAVVVGGNFLIAGLGDIGEELIGKTFHAQRGGGFLVDLRVVFFDEFPRGAIVAPLPQGLFHGGFHQRFIELGEAFFGFLCEQDAIDHFLFGLGEKFVIALAAGDFGEHFRCRLDALEGIFDQGWIDGFLIDD